MNDKLGILLDVRDRHHGDAAMVALVDRCVHMFFRVQAANDCEGRDHLVEDIVEFTDWLRRQAAAPPPSPR